MFTNPRHPRAFRVLHFIALFAGLLVVLASSACTSDESASSSGTEAPPPGGILRVYVLGLPEGQAGAVVVSGKDYEQTLSASADVPVEPGEYVVIARGIADEDLADGSGFLAKEGSTTVTVTAEEGAVVRVQYEAVAPKIADEARVVGKETADALDKLTSDDTGATTLVFSSSTTETSSWQAGDLLVFGVTDKTPQGFLGRVVSSDGKTVETEPAALQDLIQEGVIDFSKSFTPDDISAVENLTQFAPNLRLCGSLTSGLGASSGAVGVALTVGGELCISPTLDINLGFRLFAPPDIYVRAAAGVTGSLFVEGTATVGIEKEIPILTIQLGTITIPLGPVPVVILPQLTISVGAGGKVTAGVTAGIDFALNPTGGFHYDGGKDKFYPFAAETHDFGFHWPEPIATATLEGFAGPNIDILFYGVAGPYVGVRGYLAFDVDLLNAPAWELHAGLDLNAGITTNRLFKIDWTASLLNFDVLLATSEDTPPNGTKLGGTASHAALVNPALASDDVMIIAAGSEVRAVKTKGAAEWAYTGSAPMTSVLRASDGNIYAADFDGSVYALDKNGAQRWTQTMSSRASLASPAADKLYVGEGAFVRSLDTQNGAELWNVDVGDSVRSVAVAKDGTLYATTFNGVNAVTSSGALAWAQPPSIGQTAAPGAAIAPDGTIYVAVYDGPVKLAAVSPSGAVKWMQAALSSDQPSSPVVGADGTIYLCGTLPDPSLVALNPADGSVKWKYRHDEYCEGPPALAENGTLYMMTDASMRALDAATGKELWNEPTPGNGSSPTGSPLFLPSGIVVGVNSGGLWSFYAGTGLATHGWPRAGGNNASTGVSP
ncbi:MAG: PQQ-binding-like beta-propeller repeat protein [Polyangiaceae bacterium]